MNNGIYHIKDNKIYKMSIDKPEEQIGVVASIEDRNNLIDDFANNLINKIESKYCHGDLTSQYIGMQTCEWIKEIAETMKRRFTVKVRNNMKFKVKHLWNTTVRFLTRDKYYVCEECHHIHKRDGEEIRLDADREHLRSNPIWYGSVRKECFVKQQAEVRAMLLRDAVSGK